MDTAAEQLFISEIQLRPIIWDKRDTQYKNSYKKGKEWDDVASKLRFPKISLKNKWRSLVAKYKSETNLVNSSRSGDGADASYQSQWTHYKSLHFLSDTVNPAGSTGNLFRLFEEELYEDEELFEESDIENRSPNKIPTMSGKRTKVFSEAPVQPKKVKNGIENEVTDMSNDDLMFFRTLASHVQKIDPDKKLQFRNEVNSIVQKYVYGISSGESLKTIEDDDDCIIVSSTVPKKEKKEKKYRPPADMTNNFNEGFNPQYVKIKSEFGHPHMNPGYPGYSGHVFNQCLPTVSPMLGAAFFNQVMTNFLMGQQMNAVQNVSDATANPPNNPQPLTEANIVNPQEKGTAGAGFFNQLNNPLMDQQINAVQNVSNTSANPPNNHQPLSEENQIVNPQEKSTTVADVFNEMINFDMVKSPLKLNKTV